MIGLNAVIDISHHNTVRQFHDVAAAGIKGIIHKATQGTSYVDPTYHARAPRIRQAGMMGGAYHFATGEDGVGQAKHFLDVVQPDERTLLALDFEPNLTGSTMTVAGAEHFVQHIYNETGRWPVFYSGHLIKELLKAPHPVLSKCPLWLAQYGPTPVLPVGWEKWTLWQYTDGIVGPQPHAVPGIGSCDRDTFNGSLNELRVLWGYPPLS